MRYKTYCGMIRLFGPESHYLTEIPSIEVKHCQVMEYHWPPERRYSCKGGGGEEQKKDFQNILWKVGLVYKVLVSQ